MISNEGVIRQKCLHQRGASPGFLRPDCHCVGVRLRAWPCCSPGSRSRSIQPSFLVAQLSLRNSTTAPATSCNLSLPHRRPTPPMDRVSNTRTVGLTHLAVPPSTPNRQPMASTRDCSRNASTRNGTRHMYLLPDVSQQINLQISRCTTTALLLQISVSTCKLSAC